MTAEEIAKFSTDNNCPISIIFGSDPKCFVFMQSLTDKDFQFKEVESASDITEEYLNDMLQHIKLRQLGVTIF